MSEDAQAGLGSLSELVAPVNEKIAVKKDPNLPYVGLEHIGQRNSQLLGWAPSESSVSVNSVFEVGDVLFGKLRPNLRKCVSAPFSGYCSTDILVLRARNGNDPGFAARVFQTEAVGAEAERTSMGTKMPRTSWKGLSQFRVPIPEPKHQSKIAEVLDTLDAAIRGTEAVVAKLRAMKQGLLHDLLTRGIDANGDLRPPQPKAPRLYHQTPLGWLPKEWDVVPLSDSIGFAYRYPTYYGIDYVEQGVPEVRGELIEANGNLTALGPSYRFISEATAQRFPRVRLELNDVVMSVRGTIGKFGRVNESLVGAVITANLLRLQPNLRKVIPSWLMTYLMCFDFQNRLDAACSATTIKTIQVPELLSILTARPQRDEQESISLRVSSIEKKLQFEEGLLDKLRLQKSGLMDDLLTGRVPVTPLL